MGINQTIKELRDLVKENKDEIFKGNIHLSKALYNDGRTEYNLYIHVTNENNRARLYITADSMTVLFQGIGYALFDENHKNKYCTQNERIGITFTRKQAEKRIEKRAARVYDILCKFAPIPIKEFVADSPCYVPMNSIQK